MVSTCSAGPVAHYTICEMYMYVPIPESNDSFPKHSIDSESYDIPIPNRTTNETTGIRP